MAYKVTQEQLERWKSSLASAGKKLALYKDKADSVVERGVRMVEIGGAAFAWGVAKGKTGGIDFLGVPLDLWAGLGLNALGFVGVGGHYGDHLHNLGNGSLASFMTTLGAQIGDDWRLKGGGQKKIDKAGVKGRLDGHRGQSITDEQLADLVAA